MAPLEIVYLQLLCIPSADGASFQVNLAVRTNKPILCRGAVMGAALLLAWQQALGMSDTRSAPNIAQRAGYRRTYVWSVLPTKLEKHRSDSSVSWDKSHESTTNPESFP